MYRIFTFLMTVLATSLMAQTTTVWNPAGNGATTGLWSEAANWTGGVVPDGDFKVVFNVPDAQDARLDDTRSITQFVLGDNNPGGTLVVTDGGNLTTSMDIWSAVGYNDTARLVVETGGEVTFGQHMWVGLIPNSHGTVELNGGTINVSAQTGLGWDGGKGYVYLNDGTLNISDFSATQSIGDSSFIDIGNGSMIIQGDQVQAVNDYVAAGKIIAFQGTGTVMANFDETEGTTTVVGNAGREATTVWNPGGNPESTGLWSEAANWSDGFVPAGNKVVFNVPDAPDATLNTTADTIRQFVLGDNGPGGTLVVADGGKLVSSSEIWSAVGYNDTARLVVETGGEVTFGQHMWVGLTPDGVGTVELNGGTINVGAMTGLGWDGGTGFVYVNDGTLNMTGFDPANSIKDGSVLEIGDGAVNIPGDQVTAVEAYASANKIVARGGGMVSATYDATADMTTVVAASTRGATTVWNPAGNPESTGLWSEAANWSDGFVPAGNKVVFNVPDAPDATLNTTADTIRQFVLGDNGPGGTLVIADSGILVTSSEIWSAIGYNDMARLVVESGGEITFGQHMWVGLTPDGVGTVELNGGTINVGAMTGLGWDGGKGFVYVNDGELNMTGFDASQSIGDSSMMVIGDGTVNIDGDVVGAVEVYEAAGKIAASDSMETVVAIYDEAVGITIVTAEPSTSVGRVVIPGKVALRENYPNPFQQATTVDFTLEESAQVRIVIYNAAGQRVTELVNRKMEAGDHKVVWNADRQPAGTYVVNLRANSSMVARQIVLSR